MRRIGFRRGFIHRPFGAFMYGPFRPFWHPWRPFFWNPFRWLPWTMFMGGFAYLLYGSMIYKMHRDDLGRIEQDAGRPARDLSEEELKAAMRRRGIEKLELTPEDKKAIAQSRKQRFCVYCGAELTSDAKYCHRCGGKAQ